MEIKLKKLVLQNFKGAANQTVEFSDRTSILGANATGKTRIFDAFTWLLFGKDSEDRKDFNIKTLNAQNEPLHRVEYSVAGTLSVDGMDETFERVYREKWIKKRGEETQEFSGHETSFFVNKVPMTMKDYQSRVDAICREDLFKLLTNPMQFNSLPWQARRELLFDIAGQPTDQEVAAGNPELVAFLKELSGKSYREFKAMLTFEKKKLVETLQQIPPRTDEVYKAIVDEPDYARVQADIDSKTARITQIDTLLSSQAEKLNAANRENQEKQQKIFALQSRIKQIQFSDLERIEESVHGLKVKKTRLQSEIIQIKADIASHNDRISQLITRKISYEAENDKLRADWTKANEHSLVFNENEFICPACKRPFEADDIEAKKEQMNTEFNRRKTSELESITARGKSNAAEIEKLDAEIERLRNEIGIERERIPALEESHNAIIIPEKPEVKPSPEITGLEAEIENIRTTMTTAKPADNSELKDEKARLFAEIDLLKNQMNIREQNDRLRERIAELNKLQKEVSQKIADIEGREYQAEMFAKAKTYLAEERVNKLFTTVKFKMFNGLVNGGSEETCETLINGVPYQDANHAAKINCGIDIINVLSNHYGTTAPIYVDNAEAVNEILESRSQMVKLVVSSDKELKIINS